MTIKQLFSRLGILVLSLIIAVEIPQPGAWATSTEPELPSGKVQDAVTCHAILTRAFETLQNTCNSVARNRACYGNNNVVAQLNDTSSGPFSTPGDRVPIQVINSLITSPLDTVRATWGLLLLKLQANLPDTLAGQNVTFLVYGDTTVTNQSGDMKAFYFSSGLGSPTCKEAPLDGIVVRSPNHMRVTFLANKVQITIASTIVMHATLYKTMSVQLVEGQATITTP